MCEYHQAFQNCKHIKHSSGGILEMKILFIHLQLQRGLIQASFIMLIQHVIKTHGSESRGQEEAACTRVFWPTRPLQ